ncbi:hypothetical protein [Mycoplasma sp. 1018B]|uniref:hypothetical protein n=1 Tax=Mycoplasma sp. 1018B TaxID=2967302 RepID=UPI00211BE376|nr:hypothetical protein [Mycoplasma sp. 1018B]UUM18980.1 hypothetical protein NPA14_01415 [Mycoplasma sp. 1018B]
MLGNIADLIIFIVFWSAWIMLTILTFFAYKQYLKLIKVFNEEKIFYDKEIKTMITKDVKIFLIRLTLPLLIMSIMLFFRKINFNYEDAIFNINNDIYAQLTIVYIVLVFLSYLLWVILFLNKRNKFKIIERKKIQEEQEITFSALDEYKKLVDKIVKNKYKIFLLNNARFKKQKKTNK